MHTTIDYSKLPSAEKDAKAMADLENWFGKKRFKELTAAWHNDYSDPAPFEHFYRLVSFLTGFRGYPVLVWYEHCWPEVKTQYWGA
jgi:hypothetical protein